MRQLTATLQSAQQQSVKTPAVKVRAINKNGGVIRQKWSRLYAGAEPDYHHGLAIAGDGSLIRMRVTPATDSRKIYRQRVTGPGPGSDFSQWVYTGQYDAVAAAVASCGAEVSIFWFKTTREIKRIKSIDNGATWASPEILETLPTTSVNGMSAAYKPGGGLAIFFIEQETLYVKKYAGGQWQAKSAWDKTTGILSGLSSVYDGDWELLVTGQDASGNYKVWSLVYGDGGQIAAGAWSALKEVATAPAGGSFSFKQPFLDKPDTVRCFFVESFAGTEAYKRPFTSYIIPGTGYAEGLWREPAPFNLSSEYGLALAHHGDYAWLSSPSGVWRAAGVEQVMDVSGDVIAVRQDTERTAGALAVELVNDGAKYALPGQSPLEMLDVGCTIEFSPGYVTPLGGEYSEGQSCTIESFEHVTGGGKSRLIIYAEDSWEKLNGWQARQQLRWNKNGDDFSVKNILAVILARAGLKMNVISQSEAVTGFYPDFTVNPGNNGKDIIRKLLAMVPDRLFIEGDIACLVNPQPDDAVSYAYGAGHVIVSAKYGRGSMDVSRAQVEGWDPSAGKMILVDVFSENYDDVDTRMLHVEDRNLNTVAEAVQRGTAALRQAEIEMDNGRVTMPVNCAQQLYDVVAVTDIAAGLTAQSRRVTGITLVYNPAHGEYYQCLKLGKV